MRTASGRAVFRALIEADVRFLVAGGIAVNVHGYMRMTLDIDIAVKLETGNIASESPRFLMAADGLSITDRDGCRLDSLT